MIDKTLYNENSIESLPPREFIRLKPGVYAGDTTYSTQLLIEIVSNSVDEFRLGHGNLIEVKIDDDSIMVRDYGQGFIPNSYREDGKTILEAAFTVLNTSGKFRQDGTYEGTSLGNFGIGGKITNFLSHKMEVQTWRDGETESLFFIEGELHTRHKPAKSNEPNGTYVRWQPSEEFFTHTEVESKKVHDYLKTLSCLCPGLTIHLEEKGKIYDYVSPRGINDLVDAAVGDKELIDSRFEMNFEEGKNKMDIVLTYTSNYSFNIVPYVNTGLTESGPHITQIKTIITREFNKFFKEKGWLKAGDANLTGDDIQEGMYIVFNITAPNVAYDAQVKSRVTKIDMKPFNTALAENLNYWLNNNEREIKFIADKALTAKKAREAAKKARERAREQGKKKEKALKFDTKLADCYGTDRSKCELYIVEGDSAAGNLKTARNNEFQAVMPVRGKILNTHKATADKIQKNAEIMNIIDALGLAFDPKAMQVIYDPDKLRYGKIIIESDADVDGAHIKNLFYTFAWNFCPELFYYGHIYAGVPPLYKVTLSGNKGYKYLKNDDALEEFRKTNAGKYTTVNRLKGLGEMSVEETEETLTDPENRIIKQIVVRDVEKANKLFNDLMGTAILPRKNFIQEHSGETIE